MEIEHQKRRKHLTKKEQNKQINIRAEGTTLTGAGPGGDQETKELSSDDIAIVREQWGKEWGGTLLAPGIVDRANIKTWITSCARGQEQGNYVIANSKDTREKGTGHWVLLEYRGKDEIHIWDPLGSTYTGTTNIQKEIENTGKKAELHRVGTQTDGWTCGYHVLEWVRQATQPNQVALPETGPNVQYDIKKVVDQVRKVLNRSKKTEPDIKQKEHKEKDGEGKQRTGHWATEILKQLTTNREQKMNIKDKAEAKTSKPEEQGKKEEDKQQGKGEKEGWATQLLKELTKHKHTKARNTDSKKKPTQKSPNTDKRRRMDTGEENVLDSLRIATNNVQGRMGVQGEMEEQEQGIDLQNGESNKNNKIPEIITWMKQQKVEAFLGQEVKLSLEETRKESWGRQFPIGWKVYYSVAQSGKRERGAMTILGPRLAPLVMEKDIVRDEEGRFLAVPLRTLVKGQRMWVINIYGPAQAGEKDRFWQTDVPNRMEITKAKCSTKDIVIIGTDTNIAHTPSMDIHWEEWAQDVSKAYMQKYNKQATALQEWMEEDDLVDAWRMKAGMERSYTWGHAQKEQEMLVNKEDKKKQTTPERRLDYILINKAYKDIVREVQIRPVADQEWNTDHKTVVMEVIGLKVLRQIEKREWQRPTYKARDMGEAQADKIIQGLTEWQ